MESTNAWIKWLQRLRGPAGPEGPPGPTGAWGPTGPPGRDGEDFTLQTIKLPVDVVVVMESGSTGGTAALALWGRRKLEMLHQVFSTESPLPFFAELGIILQPRYSTVYTPGDLQAHHYGVTPHVNPTVYLYAHQARIGDENHLGEAFQHDGYATVAGDRPDPGEVPVILIHELGHLLGLGHVEDTFMRAAIRLRDNLVTEEQRGQLRASAYRLGGY